MKSNMFISFVTAQILRLFFVVYEKIFHEKMSMDVIDFFKNIYYIGVGTIIATFFSFIFNILAGNLGGPTEYGKFTIVQSIAMFLFVPMLFGLNNAMVKYNAEEKDCQQVKKVISTTYILVFTLTIISTLIFYTYSDQIGRLFSISSELFHLSLVFSIFYVCYIMATSTLRSLHEMKILAVSNPIFSFLLLLSLTSFILTNNTSFKSIVFSMYFAYAVTGSIILIKIHQYISFEFDQLWAKTLLNYSKYSLLSGYSYIIYTNIDKILINKYMLAEDVGLYNAYYYASINLAGIFSGIIMTVFFPTASRYKNKVAILKKINRFIPYLFLIGLPTVLLLETVILKLYGENYPIDIQLMILFAITSILISCYSAYGWLFNSEGEKGVKLTLSGTVIIGISDIFLNLYLIPLFGLHGAIVSTLLAYCIGTFVLYRFKDNIIKAV